VNLWEVQNSSAQTLDRTVPEVQRRADSGDELAKEWLDRARLLADRLQLRIS